MEKKKKLSPTCDPLHLSQSTPGTYSESYCYYTARITKLSSLYYKNHKAIFTQYLLTANHWYAFLNCILL